MSYNDQEERLKIVVLGAGTVGKSAITVRMVANEFREEYDATIEDRYQCDFLSEDGVNRKLDILDTAGQDQFAALKHHWIREGDAFLLVFSLTSLRSFNHCKESWTLIERVKESDDKRPGRIDLVLVGNKSDLPSEEHQVTYQQVQDLANEFGVPFLLTSAKDNSNIREAFQTAINEYYKKDENDNYVPNEEDTGCACKIL